MYHFDGRKKLSDAILENLIPFFLKVSKYFLSGGGFLLKNCKINFVCKHCKHRYTGLNSELRTSRKSHSIFLKVSKETLYCIFCEGVEFVW